ncbi:hypothetical protein AbraIFM66950_003358 [Aspergillus brasiliensis]|nr:hypothetical protein AbraIFM66950_003358 [Aspergillus brasiliensis]
MCSLCQQSNRTICHYVVNLPTQAGGETGTDATTTGPDSSLSNRLARLEAATEEHSASMDAMKKQLRELIATANVSCTDDVLSYTPATTVQMTNPSPGGLTSARIHDSVPMTIPLGHGSTSEDLLRARKVKLLLGGHPKNMFLKTEQKRGQPEEFTLRLDSTWATASGASIEETAAADLVNVYFAEVNPRFPILDQETFSVIFHSTDLKGEMDTTVALVLMVLALASVSQETADNIKGDTLSAAAFARPSIRFLLREWPSYSRFAFGSDILAEYHLPRSGIENVMERLPYPECGPQSLDQHLLSWLGNLSARKLMNRVHFTIYNTTRSGSKDDVEHILDSLLDSPNANVLFATSAELNRQLNMWWDLLPMSIKPDMGDSDPGANKGDLLLRFWACGDIIFRPFLYKACSMPQGSVPEEVLLEPALSCIHRCRQFLQLVSSVTKLPSPFTMINLHSTLAVIINLTVASLCPFLAEYLSDIEELEEVAVSLLKRWSSKGSSIEIILKIALALRDKRRMVGSFD